MSIDMMILERLLLEVQKMNLHLQHIGSELENVNLWSSLDIKVAINPPVNKERFREVQDGLASLLLDMKTETMKYHRSLAELTR